jgi:biopolymer transport protein ExbD
MAMSSKQEGDGDDGVMSDINVTPLVDVMLVLLIIFLITVPVVKQARHVDLPTISNIETRSKPENVVLTIEESGVVSLEGHEFAGIAELKEYIRSRAVEVPQPEVHIKADRETRYANVGRVLVAIQQSGMVKVRFITLPAIPGA